MSRRVLVGLLILAGGVGVIIYSHLQLADSGQFIGYVIGGLTSLVGLMLLIGVETVLDLFWGFSNAD